MLLHPDPQVQAIFTALEVQRDQAIVEAATKAARIAELEGQLKAITESTAAAALAEHAEASDGSPAN